MHALLHAWAYMQIQAHTCTHMHISSPPNWHMPHTFCIDMLKQGFHSTLLLPHCLLQGDEALRVKSLSLLQRSQSHRFIQKTSSAHCPSSSRGHGAPSGQALQGAQSEGQQQRQLTRGKKEAQATAESFISRRQRSPLRSNQAENKAPEAGKLSS